MSGGFHSPVPTFLGGGQPAGHVGRRGVWPGVLGGIGSPQYFLLPNQELLYTCRAVIWRRTELRNSSGKVTGEAWNPIAADVPCFLQSTASDFAQAGGMIYDESDNIFTLDLWHFPAGVPIRATDVIKLTAAPSFWTGRQSDQVGQFWRCRGNIEAHQFVANKVQVRAANLEAPPMGVS